jgi:hypothetical protein
MSVACVARVRGRFLWMTTLRTSPSSGQAAISSQVRHLNLPACHSRAALDLMSKRLQDIQFVDQRALTFVVDIAVTLEESEKNKATCLGSALARSAITNAALLLECVSNSCLGSLSLPKRLLEELDRLPVLPKLDYYLFARTSKHIDRGCREVEQAVDVLKLRDHIVHPKLRKL